jgi:hypothetical protein
VSPLVVGDNGLGTYRATVDRTGLPDDAYSAVITIDPGDDPDVAPRTINVLMRVTSADPDADAGQHYVVLVPVDDESPSPWTWSTPRRRVRIPHRRRAARRVPAVRRHRPGRRRLHLRRRRGLRRLPQPVPPGDHQRRRPAGGTLVIDDLAFASEFRTTATTAATARSGRLHGARAPRRHPPAGAAAPAPSHQPNQEPHEITYPDHPARGPRPVGHPDGGRLRRQRPARRRDRARHDQCEGWSPGSPGWTWRRWPGIRGSTLLGMAAPEPDAGRRSAADRRSPAAASAPRATAWTLERARREGATAVIEVRWQTPEPGAILAQVITHPCLVVGLPADAIDRVEARDHTASRSAPRSVKCRRFSRRAAPAPPRRASARRPVGVQIHVAALAHGADQVALVDALADGGQAPVGKRPVVVDARQIAAGGGRVPLAQCRAVGNPPTAGGCQLRTRLARLRPGVEQVAHVRQRIAEGAKLPVEHGADRSAVADDHVAEPVVAVDDGGALPVPACGPRAAARSPPSRESRGSWMPATACSSDSAGGPGKPPCGRGRRARRLSGRCWCSAASTSMTCRPSDVALGRGRASGGLGVVQHDAVDETHDVERRAVHRRVVAQPEGGGHGHLAAGQRRDDAVLPAHVVGTLEHVAQGRPPQHVGGAAAVDEADRSGWSGRRR